MLSSDDSGRTWSPPRDITAAVKRGRVDLVRDSPGIGIQMTRGAYRGRIVIPCDHRVKGVGDRRRSTRSHVIFSDDHGKTWQLGEPTEYLMNECAVVERSDGSLLLNMRSNRGRVGELWPKATTAAALGASAEKTDNWSSPCAKAACSAGSGAKTGAGSPSAIRPASNAARS